MLLSLEGYIAKRKKESGINEFNQEQKLENIKICVDFVLDYFVKYLNVSEDDIKTGLHKNKVVELEKKLAKFDKDIRNWIIEIFDKYDVRVDFRIWNSLKYTENFFICYTDHEFRELSYSAYNDHIKKLPFLKDQGELLFKLIKNLHRIKSECYHTPDDLGFLPSSIIGWLNSTTVKYNVNILRFVQQYCSDFSEKTYVYIPPKGPFDTAIVKEYDYKVTKNLFDIDTLYQKVGNKPFLKGHKQELELLLMLLRDRHFVSRLDKIISRSRTGKLVR
jgi:hypothetical protein